MALEGGLHRNVHLEPLIGMLRDPRTGCPEEMRGAWGVGPFLPKAQFVEHKKCGTSSLRLHSALTLSARA